jgi:hypothetical protein
MLIDLSSKGGAITDIVSNRVRSLGHFGEGMAQIHLQTISIRITAIIGKVCTVTHGRTVAPQGE